jgi:Undecaprenyl-phosphate glucose phosphotransferase
LTVNRKHAIYIKSGHNRKHAIQIECDELARAGLTEISVSFEYRRVDNLVDGLPRLVVPKIRLNPQFIALFCCVVDVVIIAIVTTLAGYFYNIAYNNTSVHGIEALDSGFKASLFVGTLFVPLLGVRGAYSIAALCGPRTQTRHILKVWIATFFLLAWVAFLLKVTDTFSRGAIFASFVLGPVPLLVFHAMVGRWLQRRVRSGTVSLRRVFVAIATDPASRHEVLRCLKLAGTEVVAMSVLLPNHDDMQAFSVACARVRQDVRDALAKSLIDAIYIFLPWRDTHKMEQLRAALVPVAVPVYLFADEKVRAFVRGKQMRVGSLTAFEIERAPLTLLDRGLKRMLDIFLASFGLALLLPIFLLTSICILVETGSPVLFRQKRKGFGGRPFEILKFRSMTVQEDGQVIKQAARKDARVTPFGALIRRTSIDELPQLLNVLKGEMSIVGPRPHALAHDDYYDAIIGPYALRHHVRPGITGWAQVSGLRGETRTVEMMEARIEHDLWYINNWSIWLDLRIIGMTATKVLFQENAY